MTMFQRLAAALPAVVAVTVAPAGAQQPTPQLAVEPYVLRGFDGVETAAEMGRIVVPADREDPRGGEIELAFVRLPTTAEAPGSPIVFLAGGPGVPGIVMGQVPPYRSLFERLRGIGDVILLDQRGTGRSAPSLECPSDSPLPPDLLIDEERALAALLPALDACADRLRASGVEPADYTTAASADDIEDLRRALGAGRVSLLAFSYGTELALAFAGRHAEGLDRLVLASVRPSWGVVKLPSTYDRVIASLSRLAAGDSAAGIPDLERALRRSLDRLEAEPLVLVVTDRRTEAPVTLRVGPLGLQAVLQGALADGRRMPGAVAMVAALDRGEQELFRREVEGLYNSLAAGIGMMGVAMNCSAGASEERRAIAEAESRTALLGGAPNLMLAPAACAIAGDPDLGSAYREPVSSDRPALFLSGSLDPNAPPEQAEEALRGFPNAVHVVVENGSHETLPADQVQDLVVDFLAGEDVTGRAVSLPVPEFVSPAAALEGRPGPGP
ncbi:MAG TPA: alpha/beta fold hydrolase [Gemmatimonadota bacterium]|nr:alpha/beta fold hydrolase [Gemmatimonadota bacterium]